MSVDVRGWWRMRGNAGRGSLLESRGRKSVRSAGENDGARLNRRGSRAVERPVCAKCQSWDRQVGNLR